MLGKILMTGVNAVTPIVLIIALGHILFKKGFLTEGFLNVSNRLVFNICLPVMLFLNVYDIGSISDVRWDMVLYCVAMLTAIFALGWLLGVTTTRDLRKRGVIWQCVFRSNFAIIGLPLAQALGGAQGAAVAAVLSAFTIPAYNVYSVIALSAYTGKKKGVGATVKSIITNPLTIGVLAGLLALVLRALQVQLFGRVVFSVQRDTLFVYKTLDNLKAITTPLALLVLGGRCEFSAVKGMFREITVSVTARVVIAPVVAICGAAALSAAGVLPCGNGEYAALIALFGSPAAVSSAILASNMDNDGQLAAQLVVWTSILSVVTIFLISCVLMGLGLLSV